MNDAIDMMLKYPSLLPVDATQAQFQGYLPVYGMDYKLDIKYENGKATLVINPQLDQYKSEIEQLSSSSGSIINFLDSLTSLIASKTTPPNHKSFPTKSYRHILSEYVELRQFYIAMAKCTIAKDLSEINISHSDLWGRVHDLVVRVDLSKSVDVFSVSRHELPERKDVELFQSDSSLKGIYEQFVGYVDRFQNFFDVMDGLDRDCWVLDPDTPSRKDCYRRIGLDVNVSMVVTVDPWSESNIVPTIKFLGPERLVQGYRDKMGRNLLNWDLAGDVIQEILRLLELPHFPSRPDNANKEEILLCGTGECCICFSMRLNDKLPEIICQNVSCEQHFHRECLYEWLISVHAQKRFNELHGQCPNCEKHITCPLTT